MSDKINIDTENALTRISAQYDPYAIFDNLRDCVVIETGADGDSGSDTVDDCPPVPHYNKEKWKKVIFEVIADDEYKCEVYLL